MHIDNVIFLILSKNAYTKFSAGPLISLLRRTSNNFNQIARRVNSTNRAYEDDIHEMKNMLEQLWGVTNGVLEKLAAID